MPDLIRSNPAPLPLPRVDVRVRLATREDIPFMDALQKKNSRAVGYFPTKQFEGYVDAGGVLIAEGVRTEDPGLRTESDDSLLTLPSPALSTQSSALSPPRLGYLISRDRYLKRDELGVVYQLNVVPEARRSLVGATLIKTAFERAAYGCRLFCCWCAQDLEANLFWESLGFVPIAFRAGSTGKRRVHIFWQKRIVEGDTTTPWWYPFQTNAGAIRQDRIVFPIPPGVSWRDVRAVEVAKGKRHVGTKALRHEGAKGDAAPIVPSVPSCPRALVPTPRKPSAPSPGRVGILVGGRLKYVTKPGYVAPEVEPAKAERKKRVAEPAAKIDPKYLKAARELRDRWMERVNDAGMIGCGKYEVSRTLCGAGSQPALLMAG